MLKCPEGYTGTSVHREEETDVLSVTALRPFIIKREDLTMRFHLFLASAIILGLVFTSGIAGTAH